jgi:hypothetical protein
MANETGLWSLVPRNAILDARADAGYATIRGDFPEEVSVRRPVPLV